MRNNLPNAYPLQIVRIDVCESTNQQLLDLAGQGAPAGTVLVARQQTGGRGRRGRAWVAAPGKSLTFSLLWVFPPDVSRLSGLSLAVGVALVRAIDRLKSTVTPTGVTFGLKWPNDGLICRRDQDYAKAGGVLVESTARSTPQGQKELAVVIGVGLNCLEDIDVQESVGDQTVGTLSELFTTPISPEAVLPVVLEALSEAMCQFEAEGFSAFQTAWQSAHVWQGQAVQMRENENVHQAGVCQGVDDDGALILETTGGLVHIVAGDLSLRIV